MKTRFVALIFSLMASHAATAALIPISYSMPNGDLPSYGDETYNNSTCPNYPYTLCGGVGQLTDGVTVPSFFGAGNNFYMVGWGSNSIIATFYFDGTQNFGAVGLHLSDAHGQAGIGLPLTVTINAGSAQVFTPATQTGDNGNYWNWFDLAPGTSGSSVSVRLDRNDALGPWMFMDEVSLLSAAEVSGAPEPGTVVLVASGLGLAAFLKRRRA